MRILARYILRRFALNYVILAVVLMGLIVLLDLIANLDKFIETGQQAGGGALHEVWTTVRAVAGFYGPMSFLFIGYLGGLVSVAAAGFTLGSLIRTRELAAMITAGISAYRIGAVFLLAGAAVCALMLADQEWVIPQLMDRLARNQSDVRDGGLQLETDFILDRDGALFSAGGFDLRTQSLTGLTILGRNARGHAEWRIESPRATWDARRHGWSLEGAYRINGLDGSSGPPLPGIPVVFFRTDLGPLTILALRNARVRRMLSIGQMRSLLGDPGVAHAAELRQILQGRFSLLIANLLVLVIGLCFFLSRRPRNLVLQACKALAVCLGAWAAAFLTINTPPVWFPPIVTAWLPVALLLPLAVALASMIET